MLNKVILSGGGTGGHIFPAIAIADAIKEKHPQCQILFIGALGKMEMEKVPQAGYKIIGLPISGFQGIFSIQTLTLPFKIAKSLLHARRILKKEKPNVVIGTGGFASAPLLFMATLMDIPTLIQEQNSQPGKVNRMLASRVNSICVAYPGMDAFFPKEKIKHSGNPVRKQIEYSRPNRDEAAKEYGLDPKRKTVLVYGGSLGALAINEGMMQSAEMLEKNEIQVIWQTGKYFYPQTEKLRQEKKFKHIKIVEFIDRMEMAYAMADLVVSRAGAIAVSEICLLQKASILVPLPTAAQDHQSKNAEALLQMHACILLKNEDAKNEIGNRILHTLQQPELLQELAKNAGKAAYPEAAANIVREIEKLSHE